MNEGFVKLLRKHRIGLVVADTAGKWPKLFDVTTDFVYVRLHGDKVIYSSGYTSRALDEWARRIREWHKQADLYVYFDNDVKVKAPYDAQNLMRKLGLSWPADAKSSRLPSVEQRVLRSPESLGPRARTIAEDRRWNFNRREGDASRPPSRTRTGGTPARR